MSRTLYLTLPALLTAAALALSACGPTRPDADAAPLAVAGPAPAPYPSDRSNPVYPANPVTNTGTNMGMNTGTSTGTRVATAPAHAHPSPVKRVQPAYPDRVETEQVESSARAPSAVLGRVTSVETLLSESPPNSGAGAVIGGVLGGVLGHQVGGGNGNKAATVLGAVGGAVAGNSLEKTRSRDVTGYRVHVQLDNGQTRQVTVGQQRHFSTGERVRFVGDQLQPA